MRKALIALGALALLCALLIVTLLSLGPRERAAPENAPGYRVVEVPMPHRGRSIPVHLWYPAQASGVPETIGQNLLFYGFHAHRDAPQIDGDLPVVVLVHGSGGNGPRLGWLASALARAGFLVVAADHPGITSQDSWPAETVKIWERPQDVGAMIDWLAASPPEGLRPDPARVDVVGFSIGGHAALALAGFQVTKAAFIDYCASSDDALDCQWMERGGLDLATIDAQRYEASHADPRIRRFVAIDPALPRAVTEASFAVLDRPLLLINLGAPGEVSSAINVAGWEEKSGAIRYHAVPDSWHFSFLAECSTAGRLIIGALSRKSEEICTDPGERSRADVHAELIGEISAFLKAVP